MRFTMLAWLLIFFFYLVQTACTLERGRKQTSEQESAQWIKQGNTYSLNGQHDKAIEYYEKALSSGLKKVNKIL